MPVAPPAAGPRPVAGSALGSRPTPPVERCAAVVLPWQPVDGRFSYRIPAALADRIEPGVRVLVPFGTKQTTGVVVDLPPADGSATRDVLDVLDTTPPFGPHLLALTRWIADYYLCPWGEVLRAALPNGIALESQRFVKLTDAVRSGPLPETGRSLVKAKILDTLRREGELAVSQLERAIGSRGLSAALADLEAAGWVARDQRIPDPKVKTKLARFLRLAPDLASGGEPLHRVMAELERRAPKQVNGLALLLSAARRGQPLVPEAAVREAVGASAVKGLSEKGLVETVEQEVIRSPYAEIMEVPADVTLNPAQAEAVRVLSRALAKGTFQPFLLHGVTGSGKTQVYIEAMRRVRAQGQSALMLVPEIALTPQTVRRFKGHFGDDVAVLHSRMSPGERYDAWRKLLDGTYRIAIGPRSAVFAPLRDLGLVIVDEEHEASYKQHDPSPRYHARDVAVVRAKLAGATVVLGSATPSVETYFNATTGKYRLLSLPDRAVRSALLPTVERIDTKREREIRRLPGSLSVQLQAKIRDRLARGEGIILLQNRRGHSPYVECADCGWVAGCTVCAVTLTFHSAGRRLRCHTCGAERRPPDVCPSCAGRDVKYRGVGTQKVEEELAALFPSARVLRMDVDTTGRKDAHDSILKKFAAKEADILLGTQMVAKGLDFPHVTLVGVVSADTGLLMPDFRASERTFQLLTQVAGRAGRADLIGEVVVQTHQPDHPAIVLAAKHDYLGFYADEILERQAHRYPPFSRLICLSFKGEDEPSVEAVARDVTNLLLSRHPAGDVLGPAPAVISKINRLYRHSTLLKAPKGDFTVTRLVAEVLAEYAARPKPTGRGDVRITVDVDPQGLF